MLGGGSPSTWSPTAVPTIPTPSPTIPTPTHVLYGILIEVFAAQLLVVVGLTGLKHAQLWVARAAGDPDTVRKAARSTTRTRASTGCFSSNRRNSRNSARRNLLEGGAEAGAGVGTGFADSASALLSPDLIPRKKISFPPTPTLPTHGGRRHSHSRGNGSLTSCRTTSTSGAAVAAYPPFPFSSPNTPLISTTSPLQPQAATVSDDADKAKEVFRIATLLTNWRWFLAFLMFAAGNACEMLALGFASETTIVAVSNVALFWNALFAVIAFGEKFHVAPRYRGCKIFVDWDLIAYVILFAGASICAFFGPPPPADANTDARMLIEMWGELPFLPFVVFLIVVLAACFVRVRKNIREMRKSPEDRDAKQSNWGAVYIAAISGGFSALSMTLSKVSTTLLKKTFMGQSQFGSAYTYIIIFMWVFCLVSALVLLNMGLRYYEQALFVPLYEIIGTLLTMVTGLMYYKTYREFDVTSAIGFGAGVLLLIFGIYLCTLREGTAHPLDDEDDLLHAGSFDSFTTPAKGYGTYTPPTDDGGSGSGPTPIQISMDDGDGESEGGKEADVCDQVPA